MTRWMKFNLVGAIGIAVQLGMLALLRSLFKMNDVLSTALAVEAAVIHNFFWHEAVTWADRRTKQRWARWLNFNITTGMFSIAGNVLLTKMLANQGIPLLVANGISIALCSLGNFLINDRFVFVSSRK